MARTRSTSAIARSLSALLAIAALARAAGAAEMRVERDVAYVADGAAAQRLDVYAPAAGRGHPVLFWIHGGGWQHGDKSEAGHKPQAWVDRGYVFISTNYRFTPDASIRELAGDVAKAIHWTIDHAGEFGGDPKTLFIMGHSAGAQLAALLCTDERYLKAEGVSLSAIKGCIPVDGDTYDLVDHVATVEQKRADFFRRHFGDEASQKELSSVTYAAPDKQIPPFLILHVAGHPETGDQSRRLAAALRAAKVPVEVFAAEGKTHVSLDADLGPADDLPTQEVWKFLDGHVKELDRP